MLSDTLYVFGDQSLDLLPSIQRLSRQCRQIPALKEFMRAATDCVQHAVLTIPVHIRPRIAPFDSPVQLAEAVEKEPGCAPFISSLLAIVQLGDFIIHLSSSPCILDGSQSSPTFLGLCTGSLSAAAVAASRNLTELLQIAPHIVSLAFHVGQAAFRRSCSLESSNESWATIIKDVDPEEIQTALDSFNQKLGDRVHRRVYVSAIAESAVTISGPPSVSHKFLDGNPLLKRSRRMQLPIKSAFHARHLMPIPLARIFQHIDTGHIRRNLRHRILSPCSGGCYESSRLDHILHQMVDEILQQPIDWRTTTRELPKFLMPSATAITMGPFLATHALSKWLPSQQNPEVQPQVVDEGVQTLREGSGAIAVIGMSIRAPGSETLEEFWDILEGGRDLHEEVPADRFDVNTYCDRTGKTKNSTLTPYGVFIDRPGYFDPRFFNMSPREAFQTDPQQRLMLLTTYEALENAGYSPNRTPSSNTRRIASFIGQTGDDYREFNANQNIDTYFITGNIRAFGPGRLNYHFGWEGPSFSVDTACSSSGASIQLACSALLSRECDTAISGGANLLTSPDLFAGLSRGGFLSKTGGCKTFDQNADGYVRGEGCGIIILKRLEDAVADRDNVLAVIRGAATNHSAEAVSITHPHEKTQERLFRAVLNDAGVFSHDVDVAEIHGTGTQAGDLIESRSVTNILGHGRSPEHPLILSTVKPNIGHGEAASGVTSIIKAILMMQKNLVPPHIGIKGLINDKLPSFEDVHAVVCSKVTPFFPRANGDGKRRILVNNFDAAGGNTCMLLEDAPEMTLTGQDPRSHKVIAISAKSATALAKNTGRFSDWLQMHPSTRLEDLAYTTTSRRMHYPYRKAYVATSLQDLAAGLRRESTSKMVGQVPGRSNTIFCFSGQGSQHASMASMLYKTHPTFRDCINEYASICSSYEFPSFLPIIQGDLTVSESPMRTQLSIVAIELALALLWKSWGVQASAVIGHSLGEYAALCYAGVLSPSDCFYLVGKRAELIVSKCKSYTHAMLAIQAPAQQVDEYLRDLPIYESEIACLNSPKSTVVSGPFAEIDYLNEALRLKGLSTRTLSTPHAFHSSQLDVVLEEFESISLNISYGKPTIPVASTLLERVVTEDDVFGPRYLRMQTRNPVRFQSTVAALYTASIANERTVWVEIGPTPSCLNMLKAIKTDTPNTLPSLQKCRSDWEVLSSSVVSAYNAGLEIDWTEFHRPFEQSLKLVQLPNYSFDLKNYWMYKGNSTPDNANRQMTSCEQRCSFLPTEGLHRMEKDESNSQTIKMTFAADASKPNFNKVLRGHLVNGVALCPSSVYADMAFAVASYMCKLSNTGSGASIEINNMEVVKPLIIHPGSTEQIIRVTATMQRSSNEIQLQYSSQDSSLIQHHATCDVHLANAEQSALEWSKVAYHIGDRIDHLYQASLEGKAHRLLRSMVYKLFKTFVEYDDEYQGLEEVFLNTDMLEAAAKVKFRSDSTNFACNPYWIDSFAHLSGFVLNGSEFTPEHSVFISHGWKSMKIMSSLSSNTRYRSYVRMQPSTRRNILTGDVYLFEGDNIVAICQDLKFQQVKRNVLDHILPRAVPSSLMEIAPGNQFSPLPPRAIPPPGVSAAKPEQCMPLNDAYARTKLQRVMDIIAIELGTDVSCLDEDAGLSDLGIDSLMVTRMTTMVAAELDIHLPASVFIECRSIRELRFCLSANLDPSAASTTMESTRSTTKDQDLSSTTMQKRAPAVDFVQVLNTLARELSIDVSELEDDVLFADLGVDSLLTISILSSLIEVVGEPLPTSLFTQYPTVADLRLYFRPSLHDQQLAPVGPDLSDDQSISDEESTNHNTPATESGYCDNEGVLAHKSITTEVLRRIVAEELGTSTREIEDDALLVELGVDSLLTLSIITRVKQQTGIILASTFLNDNPTFSAIERTLADMSMPQPAGMNSTGISPSPLITPPSCARVATQIATKTVDAKTWSASSVLLQGSSMCREPKLFLIPDGSGSASSYIGLPFLNHTGAVYGLNSPFLADPDSFKMPLQDLVTLYVAEMLRLQPVGPYHIGGWSIGGICAFEAVSQLIRRHGQEVLSLILIDAPCPTILPPLPIEDVDFLQSIGAFETLRTSSKVGGGVPVTSTALGLRDGVREHFAGSLNALEQYRAEAIDDSRAPESVIILWAGHGVWETLGEEMKFFTSGAPKNQHPTTSWLMDSRPKYGSCGWEELLPGSNFTCHSVQGDHFSVMRKPGVLEMGAKISSSLGRSIEV